MLAMPASMEKIASHEKPAVAPISASGFS